MFQQSEKSGQDIIKKELTGAFTSLGPIEDLQNVSDVDRKMKSTRIASRRSKSHTHCSDIPLKRPLVTLVTRSHPFSALGKGKLAFCWVELIR